MSDTKDVHTKRFMRGVGWGIIFVAAFNFDWRLGLGCIGVWIVAMSFCD